MTVMQSRCPSPVRLAALAARGSYPPAALAPAACCRDCGLPLSWRELFERMGPARIARRYPEFIIALAEDSVSLGAVALLAPYLTPETAAELLEAARHMTIGELQALLARRYRRRDPAIPVALLEPVASRAEGGRAPRRPRQSGSDAGARWPDEP
jgi:hypothetical protein